MQNVMIHSQDHRKNITRKRYTLWYRSFCGQKPYTADLCSLYKHTTIYSRYIAAQYNMVLRPAQQLPSWNFGNTSNSRKTPIPRSNGRAIDVFRELFGDKWLRELSGVHCTRVHPPPHTPPTHPQHSSWCESKLSHYLFQHNKVIWMINSGISCVLWIFLVLPFY